MYMWLLPNTACGVNSECRWICYFANIWAHIYYVICANYSMYTHTHLLSVWYLSGSHIAGINKKRVVSHFTAHTFDRVSPPIGVSYWRVTLDEGGDNALRSFWLDSLHAHQKSLDIHLTAVLQGADRSLYRSTHFYVIFHYEISSVLFRFLKTHMKARLNAVLWLRGLSS